MTVKILQNNANDVALHLSVIRILLTIHLTVVFVENGVHHRRKRLEWTSAQINTGFAFRWS